ncbi:MAG TPA: HAMP domain-containing sensor histidine kinase [Prolixibacteraceae bacterium]
MSIRQKILIAFSLVTITLIGVAFLSIYALFSEYRVEEFQQRQKERITNTLRLLTEVKNLDDKILKSLNRNTINDLYNEKLLIFDRNKKLIYTSIDDTPIPFPKAILNKLSEQKTWIYQKDGQYDVVGMTLTNLDISYYGISKAYDTFGYSKLNYLRDILISTFIGISVIIILVSFYLSRKLTQPIVNITRKINNYNFNAEYTPIEFKDSKDEIAVLARQFNKLMKRMNEVFSFQKHAIHHISHELKTPIAILVSNFERIEKETNPESVQAWIQIQKEDTKSLSEVINSLLEIAKAESDHTLMQESIRIDELIFDVADELSSLYPDFQFSVEYSGAEDEHSLVVLANVRLLKAAISNLMVNCAQYSNMNKAKIILSTQNDKLMIDFENKGPVISEAENQYLFQHFFRGESSKGKKGFGLGLVFIHKIMTIHGGAISYASKNNDTNIFTLSLPLSLKNQPEG